jgi:hypothetical protein
MKNNLKIIIAIIGAVILAATVLFLIWKFTSHNGAVHPAGKGAGHYLDRKQLAFAGYATPEATLQSIAWAAISGNGDKVFACLCPEDQADIGKKPNGRTKFNANIKYQGQLIKGMEITARKVLAGDKVELKFKLDTSAQPKNGGPIPDFLVQPLVKFGGEWKICGSTKGYTPDWDNGSQPEPAAP